MAPLKSRLLLAVAVSARLAAACAGSGLPATGTAAGSPSPAAAASPFPAYPLPPTDAVAVPTMPQEPTEQNCGTARIVNVRLAGDQHASPSVWVEYLDGTHQTVLWPPHTYAVFRPNLELRVGSFGYTRGGEALDLIGGPMAGSDLFAVCEYGVHSSGP